MIKGLQIMWKVSGLFILLASCRCEARQEEGGVAGKNREGDSLCPTVESKTAADCVGTADNCWSPGMADVDCPENAACCFNGCSNTCQAMTSFRFFVEDIERGAHFSRNEISGGNSTKGSYTVRLPNGQTQHVVYTVDGDGGYKAEVRYFGDLIQELKVPDVNGDLQDSFAIIQLPNEGRAPREVITPRPRQGREGRNELPSFEDRRAEQRVVINKEKVLPPRQFAYTRDLPDDYAEKNIRRSSKPSSGYNAPGRGADSFEIAVNNGQKASPVRGGTFRADMVDAEVKDQINVDLCTLTSTTPDGIKITISYHKEDPEIIKNLFGPTAKLSNCRQESVSILTGQFLRRCRRGTVGAPAPPLNFQRRPGQEYPVPRCPCKPAPSGKLSPAQRVTTVCLKKRSAYMPYDGARMSERCKKNARVMSSQMVRENGKLREDKIYLMEVRKVPRDRETMDPCVMYMRNMPF